MKGLVSIGPPYVDPVVLEVEPIVHGTNVRGDVRESVQLLERRRVHALWTLAGVAKPEKRKARVEVRKCDLAAAGRQRTTEQEHSLAALDQIPPWTGQPPRSRSNW